MGPRKQETWRRKFAAEAGEARLEQFIWQSIMDGSNQYTLVKLFHSTEEPSYQGHKGFEDRI